MWAQLKRQVSTLDCIVWSKQKDVSDSVTAISKTYLIAQISESEGQQFPLWYTRHAEVEPRFVVLSIRERGSVLCHPDVKVIFLEPARSLRHISTAELATKDNFRLRDLPSGPLGKRFNLLFAVDRLERRKCFLLGAASIMVVIVRLTRGPAPAAFRLRLTALLQRKTVHSIVVGGLQLLRL